MTPFSFAQQQLWETVRGARRLLLIVPKNPDGDSVGAITALIGVARYLQKPYTAVTIQPIHPRFSYLPYVEEITLDQSVVRDESYDVAIIPDAGDVRYTGTASLFQLLRGRPTLINIDHHITNEHYGDINVVDPHTSSTTELITTILRMYHVPITPRMATSLLTGIVTDTGNFSNPATTESSLKVAAFLLECGARFPTIVQSTRKNKKLSDLQAFGTALMRLTTKHPFGIAMTLLTKDDLKRFAIEGESLEGIANFLNNLEGAKAILVLKELPSGKIQGSLRTTRNDVDVSRLALLFGGGGHKKAAGFTIDGRIVETKTGWRVE